MVPSPISPQAFPRAQAIAFFLSFSAKQISREQDKGVTAKHSVFVSVCVIATTTQ